MAFSLTRFLSGIKSEKNKAELSAGENIYGQIMSTFLSNGCLF
jgi:hypothetical protein